MSHSRIPLLRLQVIFILVPKTHDLLNGDKFDTVLEFLRVINSSFLRGKVKDWVRALSLDKKNIMIEVGMCFMTKSTVDLIKIGRKLYRCKLIKKWKYFDNYKYELDGFRKWLCPGLKDLIKDLILFFSLNGLLSWIWKMKL